MSLDLDDRQRAMLKEMGVRVWWPKVLAAPAPVLAVTPVVAVAPSVKQGENPLKNNKNEKFDDKSTEISTNSIAAYAINLRPIANPNKDENIEKRYLESAPPTEGLSWPALRQTVAACHACALCEGRTQTVFGVGQLPPDDSAAPQVDWLIVGEAPGENEDRVGEPFVGQAGQLLDNMLKAMKVSRISGAAAAAGAPSTARGVYITNVIKCRPPGNRNPSLQEVAQCEPYLHQQIALLRPKMILALGKFAATSLLRASVPEVDKMALGKLRGQVHSYSHGGLTVPVVASYHPAYLLRSLTEKAKAWEDLCLAMAAMEALQPRE